MATSTPNTPVVGVARNQSNSTSTGRRSLPPTTGHKPFFSDPRYQHLGLEVPSFRIVHQNAGIKYSSPSPRHRRSCRPSRFPGNTATPRTSLNFADIEENDATPSPSQSPTASSPMDDDTQQQVAQQQSRGASPLTRKEEKRLAWKKKAVERRRGNKFRLEIRLLKRDCDVGTPKDEPTPLSPNTAWQLAREKEKKNEERERAAWVWRQHLAAEAIATCDDGPPCYHLLQQKLGLDRQAGF
ncbi:unnamed protein product [Discula destructiva]